MTTLTKTARRLPDQAGYIRSVRLFSDQFRPGEPGHGSPDSFVWTYDSRFKLLLLAGVLSDWKDFAEKDKAAWREDYGENDETDFEKWWLPKPSRCPVIVVEGSDQEFYVWDGTTRVGLAILDGRRTLPALVGYRKKRCPC
jgi:hypothetical protein